MMKHEFEARIGATVTKAQYEVIELVYAWHPSVTDSDGKTEIAAFWKQGGMEQMERMAHAAMAMKRQYQVEREISLEATKRIDELNRAIREHIATIKLHEANITECRTQIAQLEKNAEMELRKARGLPPIAFDE